MVSTDLLITQVLNGLSIGLSVALIAIGLTLVFGVLDIVNLAHGEFFMLGGYGIFALYPNVIPNFAAAVFISSIIVAAIGILVERLTLNPVRDRDPIATFIITFSWIFILQRIAFEIFGGRVKTIQAPIEGSMQLVGVSYPTWRSITIVGALFVIVCVYLLLEQTRLGVLVRASGDNIDMARTLGISSRLIFISVFGFAAFLAGISAGFIAPIRGVTPTIGLSVLIPAFIAVIIGGLGSVTGTLLAAVGVSMIESISAIWIPPYLSTVGVFALMIAVLLIKPEGIFDKAGVEG